jgi:hypothetical protein
MCMNSIPVYYRNPLVHLDFNVESIIQVKGTEDFDRAIEEIIYFDKDDEAYIEILKKPWIKEENIIKNWEKTPCFYGKHFSTTNFCRKT